MLSGRSCGSAHASALRDPELVSSRAKRSVSLVRDAHVNLKRRSVVRALLGLCNDELGADAICEGVELSGQCDALSAAGASLMQN